MYASDASSVAGSFAVSCSSMLILKRPRLSQTATVWELIEEKLSVSNEADDVLIVPERRINGEGKVSTTL